MHDTLRVNLRWALGALAVMALGLLWLVRASVWHDDTAAPDRPLWVLDTATVAPGAVVGPWLTRESHTVALPDAWRLSGREGGWTYRWALPTCAPSAGLPAPAEPPGPCLRPEPGGAALWLPRVGWQVSVWFNGHELAVLGEVAGHSLDVAQRPRLITLPRTLLRSPPPPGTDLRHAAGAANDLRLVVRASPGQAGGVSRVWLGSASQLAVQHQVRELLTLAPAAAVGAVGLLLTVFGVWVGLRRRLVVAHLFAVDSLLWALREALWVGGVRYFDWALIDALMKLCGAAALLVAGMLLLRLLEREVRAWMWAARVALLWTVLALWMRVVGQGLDASWLPAARVMVDLAHGLAHLVGLWVTAIAVQEVWRRPSLARALILLGCLGVTGLAAADLWHQSLSRQAMSQEALRWAPYMGMCALLSVVVAVYVRVSAAFHLEAHHKQELRAQVEAQRLELERLHARERARDRDEAVQSERARIVRDMHDGLGSQLVGMLSAVEAEQVSHTELVEELHEALSQLRMTIDSLDPVADDLAGILGQLRYRLDARMRRAGFVLHWEVGAMPVTQQLSAAAVSHVQRMLYEIFSNVIRHSQAAHVWVQASQRDGHSTVVVRDDGVGFVPPASAGAGDASRRSGGRGMRHLALRAEQIGAHVQVDSAPGQGTCVCLTLPF